MDLIGRVWATAIVQPSLAGGAQFSARSHLQSHQLREALPASLGQGCSLAGNCTDSPEAGGCVGADLQLRSSAGANSVLHSLGPSVAAVVAELPSAAVLCRLLRVSCGHGSTGEPPGL